MGTESEVVVVVHYALHALAHNISLRWALEKTRHTNFRDSELVLGNVLGLPISPEITSSAYFACRLGFPHFLTGSIAFWKSSKKVKFCNGIHSLTRTTPGRRKGHIKLLIFILSLWFHLHKYYMGIFILPYHSRVISPPGYDGEIQNPIWKRFEQREGRKRRL